MSRSRDRSHDFAPPDCAVSLSKALRGAVSASLPSFHFLQWSSPALQLEQFRIFFLGRDAKRRRLEERIFRLCPAKRVSASGLLVSISSPKAKVFVELLACLYVLIGRTLASVAEPGTYYAGGR